MKARTALAVIVVLLSLSVGIAPAVATPTYRNRHALHRRYPYDVARSLAAAHRQVVSGHYRPSFSRLVYIANDNLDADNDGTACEITR